MANVGNISLFKKKETDEILYPYTHRDAVLNDDGSNPFDELKGDLHNKITEVSNLVKNTVDFINGGYFDSAGNFCNNSGFGYTDYKDIGTAYYVRGHLKQYGSNLSLVVWYDEKKNKLTYYNGDGSSETKFIDFSLKVPSGARYVRFSTHTEQETEYQYAGLVYVEDYVEDYVGDYAKNILIDKTLYIDDFNIVGYISSVAGNLSTESASFVSTDYMVIRDGMKISGRGKGFLGNIFIYCFYDKDYKYIKGYKGTPVDGTYDYEDYVIDNIPDNARYIRFSALKSNDETFITNKWDAVSYTDYKIAELSESLDLQKEFYVGYGKDDGSTYFSSLVDCLWKISETEGKKILYVYDGTYDVLEELGGMNYILSKNTTDNSCSEVHPFVTDTTIIGIGHVVLNFLLDDGTPKENYWLFSCLGAKGNFNLENIEIHSKNCRYCIHDESGGDYPNTERHYKNVRCYQNENGGVGGQAIGCGFSAKTRVYYENCYLASGKAEEAWSCHANDGCSFIFNSTIFKNKSNSHSLRISQNGQCDLYASISNCFISNGLSVRNEWAQESIEGNTKIDLINTKVPNLVNGYSIINEKITSYNTVDGTEDILLDITNG